MKLPLSFRVVLIGVFICQLIADAFGQRYCSRRVRSRCRSPSACLNFRCGTYTTYGNPRFRQYMLDAHNHYRRTSCLGRYGGNMIRMRWSFELEDNSLRWLQSLCSRNAFHNDLPNCRLTPSYDSVGQNIWTGAGGRYRNIFNAANSALREWYHERDLIRDPGVVFPYRPNNLVINHYTQMMWAESYEVGCAYLAVPDRYYGLRTYIACNYAKAGNHYDENMFYPSPDFGSDCLPGTRRGYDGYCDIFDERELRFNIRLNFTG